ncbi:MAG: Txe/YoeB family addiction module toxin [Spirochaetaceae bacterium]|jgi:hypothetical protein|nr:Txe/YoeB family addiction module toxin [Spirochaetaceae bacterium]
MSKTQFSDDAWEDYLFWQTRDKKTLKRINALIKDSERNYSRGIGKPEPLRGDLAGYWMGIKGLFFPGSTPRSCNNGKSEMRGVIVRSGG